MRSPHGSRSPRRNVETQGVAATRDGSAGEAGSFEFDSIGAATAVEDLPKGAKEFLGQMRLQAAYLQQFMQPTPPPGSRRPNAPRELAAGLPLEAARILLLPPPRNPEDGPPEDVGLVLTSPAPWAGLDAVEACFAAALRLFSILTPQLVAADLYGRYCASASARTQRTHPRNSSGRCAGLLEDVEAWGINGRAVSSANESLNAMVRNRAAACCCLLESYIGVVEDPETGEEIEHDVGAHCVLVLGGDLAGPTYVVFDPWPSAGKPDGQVLFWSAHETSTACPAAWIELSPPVAIASTSAGSEAAAESRVASSGDAADATMTDAGAVDESPETALGD